MRRFFARWLLVPALLGLFVALEYQPSANSACCYFSAKDKDVNQPAQKVFITWDPKTKTESFTVQPKFEGNADDFGMVIPTPSRPELHEMPRDFFKELAVFTILKQRQFAQSKLYFNFSGGFGALGGGLGALGGFGGGFGGGMGAPVPRKPSVEVLETGLVGSLDYKILKAGRADDLFTWLKTNRYQFSGDEAALDYYVKKKWTFTVMKIDAMQMKKNKDGTYSGDVTPTRFQFASENLVYPLRITQLSVKDKTEALFYVQAPFKADLPDDLTYQYQWVPLLQTAQKSGGGKLPGKADAWLRSVGTQADKLQKQAGDLGFDFVSGQRPAANKQGHIPATLEWAKRLTAKDIQVLQGTADYSEKVPDVDAGYDKDDVADARKGPAVQRAIQNRLAKSQRDRPNGYLVREAPDSDVRHLKILRGHLQEGQFVTKFRKTFARDEMDEDLLIVPARVGDVKDTTEYEELLPTSPP